jgi:hypothetical protein
MRCDCEVCELAKRGTKSAKLCALNPGFVFAPYVPLQVSPSIFSPADFAPRKGVMTRYGNKKVNQSFYGTVSVLSGSSI